MGEDEDGNEGDEDEDEDDGEADPNTKYHVLEIAEDGVRSFRGVDTLMFLVVWWSPTGEDVRSWEPYVHLMEDCPELVDAWLFR